MSEKRSSALKWIVILGLIFIIIAGIAAITTAIIYTSGESIKGKTVLQVDLSGDIPEEPPKLNIFGKKKATFPQILGTIDSAAENKKIKALLLNINNPSLGFAHIQELRDTVERFKSDSKKPVYAFFETAGNNTYYLSTCADKVYSLPVGQISLTGIKMEVSFMRGMFENLGIEPQFVRHGKYKSAADTLTKKKMPEPMREAEAAILDSLYKQMTEGIAKGRKYKDTDKVKSLIDGGPYQPKEALKAKLIDKLLYRNEMEKEIKKELNLEEFKSASVGKYIDSEGISKEGEAKIAVVVATGPIVPGSAGDDSPFGNKNIDSATYSDILKDIRENDSIKGVLMRVDSPGGSGIASDVIWHQEQLLKEAGKPLVVSMGDVAASGGYYISMGADTIVAEPGTITGSIGVLGGKLAMKGFYDWIGINKVILKRGKNADLFSAYKPWTKKQRKIVKDDIMHFYNIFIERVADSREMNKEEVDRIAQGRIWTGTQAKQNGLVDELGGYKKALKTLKKKAEIKEDTKVKFVKYPKRKNIFQRIFNIYSSPQPDIKELLRNPEKLNPFRNEKVLALAPQIEIK